MAADDDLLKKINEEFRRRNELEQEADLPPEDEEPRGRRLNEREVRLYRILNHASTGPVVVLQDSRSRKLPIWIDEMQAQSIALAVEGAELSRPMTHDLIRILLQRCGGELEYVLIDDLYNGIYYAKLGLIHEGNREEIDCRPSDALALAFRFKAPIYVADAVLEENQIELTEE